VYSGRRSILVSVCRTHFRGRGTSPGLNRVQMVGSRDMVLLAWPFRYRRLIGTCPVSVNALSQLGKFGYKSPERVLAPLISQMCKDLRTRDCCQRSARPPKCVIGRSPREQIGQKLKKLYQACATDELPPRLLAALKKLDEERPELSMERVRVIRETKSSPTR